ncbi:MAG TPA: hypothetical protein VLI92_04020 [Candidatus Saccharimonadales bacterium]|nr:hypothetical protein [Candidatus Saccharimonadales bacterium]
MVLSIDSTHGNVISVFMWGRDTQPTYYYAVAGASAVVVQPTPAPQQGTSGLQLPKSFDEAWKLGYTWAYERVPPGTSMILWIIFSGVVWAWNWRRILNSATLKQRTMVFSNVLTRNGVTCTIEYSVWGFASLDGDGPRIFAHNGRNFDERMKNGFNVIEESGESTVKSRATRLHSDKVGIVFGSEKFGERLLEVLRSSAKLVGIVITRVEYIGVTHNTTVVAAMEAAFVAEKQGAAIKKHNDAAGMSGVPGAFVQAFRVLAENIGGTSSAREVVQTPITHSEVPEGEAHDNATN